ncbi:globin domain-containing protein [Ditylenchus destructor]|uniref:Globin domain-containing protein n=1 Tax=Ditylenchus destructor TaxID=166010 RepID=A0AAD4NHN7_9BILA|nr:globin domain-containing protein [Ditylenchus destructor]
MTTLKGPASKFREVFQYVSNLFSPASTHPVNTAKRETDRGSANNKESSEKNVVNQPQIEPQSTIDNKPMNTLPGGSQNDIGKLDGVDNAELLADTISESETQIDMRRASQERIRSLDSAQIAIWEPDDYEKELVKRTWSDDFDFLYDLGAAIYGYIFAHNPHTKKLFPGIHQHGEHWKESREFRSQALKFVQTLSSAVKNLYHMHRLAPYLYNIGQRHVKFAERGFKPEYWDLFMDAMEVSLEAHIKALSDFDEEQRAGAIRVWRRLAFYIITHMKHGYFDELEAVKGLPRD